MFYDISPTAVCAFNESFNFKISSSRCSTKSGHRLGKQLCQKRVWFDICFRYISGSDFTRWPLSVKPTPRPLLSLSVLLRVEPGPCADCEPGAHGAAGAGAVSLRPAESLTPDFIFQISEMPHYFGKATGHRRLMTASLKPNCSQSLEG